MTRSVWRKRLKVTGLVLTIMMLTLWVFSVMFESRYSPRSQWFVDVDSGRILFWNFHATSSVRPGRTVRHVTILGWTIRPTRSPWSFSLDESWTGFAYWNLGFCLPWRSADRS